MSVWYSVLMGLLQGATEFLPVSSSAHLCLLQALLPARPTGEEQLLLDVLLHLATLTAVCTAFWPDVRRMLLELGRILSRPFRRSPSDPEARQLLRLLVLGSLPLILTLPFHEQVERLCRSTVFIGMALLCTGCLLLFGDRLPAGRKGVREATAWDAAAVGLMQALAVLPGLSRSGSTVTGGLTRGFSRSFAVKYSFLLSLPAILGASLLKTGEALRAGIDPGFFPVCAIGMLAALLSGCLSIRIVRILSDRGTFGRFRYYCWGLGLLVILAGIFLKG